MAKKAQRYLVLIDCNSVAESQSDEINSKHSGKRGR